MNNIFVLNYKFTLAQQGNRISAEKWLYLGQGLGFIILALLKFSLGLMLYLSQEWKMIWLFYIYIFIDLPVKILFPPSPLLWVKYLLRIFLSKNRLWGYFMGLLLWDITLLLSLGWMIMGSIIYPNHLEKLPFLFIPIAFSLLDSLLAFVLLLFSKNGNIASFLAILVFVFALGAINIQETGLMLFSLFSCLLAQWIIFSFLVKKEMFVT